MPCGECRVTTKKGYVEILEFTHFVEFFSFNHISENHKEKEFVTKVTVVVECLFQFILEEEVI
jgi:hypothetical protein